MKDLKNQNLEIHKMRKKAEIKFLLLKSLEEFTMQELHGVSWSKTVQSAWNVTNLHTLSTTQFIIFYCSKFFVIPHKYAHKNHQLWKSIDFILYTALHIQNNPHHSHSAT